MKGMDSDACATFGDCFPAHKLDGKWSTCTGEDKTTLNSQLYIEILREDVQMSVKEWGMAKDEFILQQDNVPKHTAKVTKAYLDSTNSQRVKLGFFIGRPSLLIEHMWAYLKIQLGKYPLRPKS
ncbi:hypothetical protein BGZ83_011411 [Gryganskiella cystojenkinii]|nr:hypothetical protein BGZ83_011411 [Gryganskiella cystojenkinii]